MKSFFSRLLAGAALVAVLSATSHHAANAQAQPALPVLGQVVQGQVSVSLTAQAAGTVVTPDQTNYGARRVACVFVQASHTGTPTNTLQIQGKDPVSGLYFNLFPTAPTQGTDATATYFSVGEGLANSTSAPIAEGVAVPAVWRAQDTVSGTTPTVTGTLTCWPLG